MIRLLNNITKRTIKNPRQVFLLDGFGALLSALLLIFLIAPFYNVFGVPHPLAIQLAIPVVGFCVYSLLCYLLHLRNWKPYLFLIAFANFAYCCFTAGIMIKYFRSMELLGFLYFSAEILIILFLVRIELMTIKKFRPAERK